MVIKVLDLYYGHYSFEKLYYLYLHTCEGELRNHTDAHDNLHIVATHLAIGAAKHFMHKREQAVKKGDRKKVREIDFEVRPIFMEKLYKKHAHHERIH